MIGLASLLVATAAAASSGGEAATRFALVVGSNRSDQASSAPLRYADDDAIAIHRLLEDAGVTSRLLTTIDEDTAALHPNLAPTPPTLPALRASFQELVQGMRATDGPVEFLFFYSGHGGIEHGEGYVVLEGGRMRRSFLHDEILAASPAVRNHVIVDACKSYFMAFAKGSAGTREAHGALLSDTAIPANTGFILSTSSGVDSHEWDRFQSGIFSHQVRSGLRGAADVDGDATISYAELGAFLRSANAAIANPKYRPEFVVRPPGAHPGDLAQGVLDWVVGADTVTLDEHGARRLYVEGPTGKRILDVHARPAESVRLYVPSERPLFLRTADDLEEWVLEGHGRISLAQLQSSRPSATAKGARHLAFERLFEAPFGRPDVGVFTATYRSAPDPLRIETSSEVPASSWLEPTLVVGAITLLVAGLSMTAWALERRYSGFDLTFDAKVERDKQIHRLNAAAVSLYSAAVVSGGVWLTMTMFASDDDDSPGVGVAFGSRF